MVEEGREVLVALPEVRVVGPEVPLEDALRVAAGLLGLVDAVERVEEDAEVPAGGRRSGRARSRGRAGTSRTPRARASRSATPALPEQDLGVIALHPRRGEARRVPARLEHRERLPELALGLVELALVHPHGAESGEAHRHARASPEDALAGARGTPRRASPTARASPSLRSIRATASRRSAWTSGSAASSVLRRRVPWSRISLRRDVRPAGLLGVGDLEEADQELLDARRRAAPGPTASRAFASARRACHVVPARPATSARKTSAAAAATGAVPPQELARRGSENVSGRARTAGRRGAAAGPRRAPRPSGSAAPGSRRSAVRRMLSRSPREPASAAARLGGRSRPLQGASRRAARPLDVSSLEPRRRALPPTPPSRSCGQRPVRSSYSTTPSA